MVVFFCTLDIVIVLLPPQHQIVKTMLRQKLLPLLFLLLSASCSDLNDDLNINPNDFTSAPGYKLLQHSELGIVNISSGEISRYVGLWTGHFKNSRGCCAFPGVNPDNLGPYYFDSFWIDIFLGGCQSSSLAINSAVENDHRLQMGVAKIMHAIYLGEAAALWGDIPCRETFDILSYPNPMYDPQKQVFEDVQILLTEAIKTLDNAHVATVYGTPVFVPNEASWVEVAHSLKARYYLIAKDYEKALIESTMGISSPAGNLLSSHRDERGAKNLYYQFFVDERPGVIKASNSHLVKLMNGEIARELETPGDSYRFNYYFQEVYDYYDQLDFNTSEDGVFAANASFPIVSWTETQLIEAEASLRTGTGDASIPFNEVRDWLNIKYGNGFPPSSSSGEQLLKQILEEKYISLFGSLQTFHDLRRTKNLLQIPFLGDENKAHPERFLYPQIEMNTNSNFPGLIDIYEPTPVNK